jgi:hypothetical protein
MSTNNEQNDRLPRADSGVTQPEGGEAHRWTPRAPSEDNYQDAEQTATAESDQQHPDPGQAGLQRDPDDWATGDEPMTAAQRSYLETLAAESGEEVEPNITTADASRRIDELRQKSPRLNE